MTIHFDTSISFDDPQIKEFIADKSSARSFTIEPTTPANFSHDPADERESGDPTTHQEQLTYLIEETYQQLENGAASGRHKVTVAYGQEVSVSANYWIFFSDDATEAGKAHGRHLLNSYDPAQDGIEVEAWVRANLGTEITEDQYLLDTEIVINKIGDRFEVDTSQRDTLYHILGIVVSPDGTNSEIHVVGDYNMPDWGRERNIQLVLINERLIADDGEPALDPNLTREVTNADDINQAGTIIDDILSEVVNRADCSNLGREQIRLLTLAAWPEFKIEWRRKTIKIGCSRITIKIPVLRVRISKLVFYTYFKIPRNVGRVVFKIAETCAIRSALGAAVLGVITSNPAAATASFTPLFKRCIEREVIRCVFPGLLVLKEKGTWS